MYGRRNPGIRIRWYNLTRGFAAPDIFPNPGFAINRILKILLKGSAFEAPSLGLDDAKSAGFRIAVVVHYGAEHGRAGRDSHTRRERNSHLIFLSARRELHFGIPWCDFPGNEIPVLCKLAR